MHDGLCALNCGDGAIRGQPVGDGGTAFELLARAHEGYGPDASADKRLNCCPADLTRRTSDNWRALFHSVLTRSVHESRLPSAHISAHLRAAAGSGRRLQSERDHLSVFGEDRFPPAKDDWLDREQQLIDKFGGEQ